MTLRQYLRRASPKPTSFTRTSRYSIGCAECPRPPTRPDVVTFVATLWSHQEKSMNAEDKLIQRQALAGLLWSKQFYVRAVVPRLLAALCCCD